MRIHWEHCIWCWNMILCTSCSKSRHAQSKPFHHLRDPNPNPGGHESIPFHPWVQSSNLCKNKSQILNILKHKIAAVMCFDFLLLSTMTATLQGPYFDTRPPLLANPFHVANITFAIVTKLYHNWLQISMVLKGIQFKVNEIHLLYLFL